MDCGIRRKPKAFGGALKNDGETHLSWKECFRAGERMSPTFHRNGGERIVSTSASSGDLLHRLRCRDNGAQSPCRGSHRGACGSPYPTRAHRSCASLPLSREPRAGSVVRGAAREPHSLGGTAACTFHCPGTPGVPRVFKGIHPPRAQCRI